MACLDNRALALCELGINGYGDHHINTLGVVSYVEDYLLSMDKNKMPRQGLGFGRREGSSESTFLRKQ